MTGRVQCLGSGCRLRRLSDWTAPCRGSQVAERRKAEKVSRGTAHLLLVLSRLPTQLRLGHAYDLCLVHCDLRNGPKYKTQDQHACHLSILTISFSTTQGQCTTGGARCGDTVDERRTLDLFPWECPEGRAHDHHPVLVKKVSGPGLPTVTTPLSCCRERRGCGLQRPPIKVAESTRGSSTVLSSIIHPLLRASSCCCGAPSPRYAVLPNG